MLYYSIYLFFVNEHFLNLRHSGQSQRKMKYYGNLLNLRNTNVIVRPFIKFQVSNINTVWQNYCQLYHEQKSNAHQGCSRKSYFFVMASFPSFLDRLHCLPFLVVGVSMRHSTSWRGSQHVSFLAGRWKDFAGLRMHETDQDIFIIIKCFHDRSKPPLHIIHTSKIFSWTTLAYIWNPYLSCWYLSWCFQYLCRKISAVSRYSHDLQSFLSSWNVTLEIMGINDCCCLKISPFQLICCFLFYFAPYASTGILAVAGGKKSATQLWVQSLPGDVQDYCSS